MEIRSYRSVFDLERRIYRIDRLRLNPSGIPVRGVVYFLCLLLGMLMLRSVPPSGFVLRLFPWYATDLAAPAAAGALLTLVRIEGRPAHLAGRVIVRHALGPRWLSGLRPAAPPGRRWRPGELLILPDGSDPVMRRLRYTGPGAVLVRPAHERSGPAPIRLRGLPGRRPPRHPQILVLARKARLHVRP